MMVPPRKANRISLTENGLGRTVAVHAVYSPGFALSDEIFESHRRELRSGTLTMAVVAALRVEGYGYALRGALAKQGIAIEQNTHYPLLRRLESQGLLSSEWREHERRTKHFYRLSEEGSALLYRLLGEFEDFGKALDRILRYKPPADPAAKRPSPVDPGIPAGAGTSSIPGVGKPLTSLGANRNFIPRHALPRYNPANQKTIYLATLSRSQP
jgi:PadR family transcriptional regulator PadR